MNYFEQHYPAIFEKTFSDVYDYECISEKEGFKLELLKELENKRVFGKNKYGENSFQISEKNAIEIDTQQHGFEELVDYINYQTHTLIQHKLGKDVGKRTQLEELLAVSLHLYALHVKVMEGIKK